MAYTKKHAFAAISVIYLLLLTAIAAYKTSTATHLSLALPPSLSYLATILPLLAGPLLTAAHALARPRRGQYSTRTPVPLVLITNVVLVIYSTVIITLLGTYASPSSSAVQTCVLRTHWMELFRAKNAHAIRAIQDTLECCGLAGPRDMPWPFADKTHKVDACTTTTGRTMGCNAAWAGAQRSVASWQMGVIGLVGLWQIFVFVLSTDRSWISNVMPERVIDALGREEEGAEGHERRTIDYLPNFNRYSDRVEEEESDAGENNRARNTIQASVENGGEEINTEAGNGRKRTQNRVLGENEWVRNE